MVEILVPPFVFFSFLESSKSLAYRANTITEVTTTATRPDIGRIEVQVLSIARVE